MKAAFLTALAIIIAAAPCLAAQRDFTRRGNTVWCRNVRFTVLSHTLIRLEYRADGAFVDAPSLIAAKRHWPLVDFDVVEEGGMLQITTRNLRLRYRVKSGRLNTENLDIELLHTPKPTVWRPAEVARRNLGGAHSKPARAGTAPQGVGVLARDGWHLLDDSRTPLLVQGWPQPRPGPTSSQDLYFFGYGQNYSRGLRDFNDLVCQIPLIPRWAFGVWFLPATPQPAAQLLDTLRKFHHEQIPLSVLLVDHWYLNGWTSFDWNAKSFPDPDDFIKQAHSLGVKLGFCVHPGGAFLPRESVYPEVCKTVGWDPEKRGIIFFDLASPKEAEAFVNVLLAPIERQGADFWWVDGAAAANIRWMNKQLWTNHLVFAGSRQPENKRGLILSRFGGLGSGRCPVVYSGRTRQEWATLRYLCYYIPTAGNTGMPYWSFDIGSEKNTPPDDELFLRAVQLATFSPIMRLNARPWIYQPGTLSIVREFVRLRESLIPYLYSLSYQSHTEGLPLCRPMYLHYGAFDEAYNFKHQYLLGESLMVAPIVRSAAEESTRESTREIWFPPGAWNDFFSGRIIEGPAVLNYPSKPDQMPVFARSGSIIPLAPPGQAPGKTAQRHIIEVYPGSPGEFMLYGDDGESLDYRNGKHTLCRITYEEDERTMTVLVGETTGGYAGQPRQRSYQVHLNTSLPVQSVEVNGFPIPQAGELTRDPGWKYFPARGRLIAVTAPFPVSSPVEITFRGRFTQESRRLAYRLREVVPRLESAAILLERQGIAEPLVRKLREVEALAEQVNATLLPASDTAKHLEQGLARVRREIRELARLANSSIEDDSVKVEFMRVVLGFSLSSSVAPTPYRQMVFRNEFSFLQYGWGSLGGTISTEGQPVQAVGPLRPEEGASFESTIDINWVPLKEVDFPVRAEIEWEGVPIQLMVHNVIDNTFIKQFYAIGPFGDGSYRRVMELTFPPERSVDLADRYTGKRREIVSWKKVPWLAPVANGIDYRFMDLGGTLKRMPSAAGYAYAQVYVPEAGEAKLLLGSEGGIAIWVNGVEIFRDPFLSTDQPDVVAVATQLRAGWNDLLVKSVDEGRAWGFYLRLVGKDDQPMPGAMSGWGPGF